MASELLKRLQLVGFWSTVAFIQCLFTDDTQGNTDQRSQRSTGVYGGGCMFGCGGWCGCRESVMVDMKKAKELQFHKLLWDNQQSAFFVGHCLSHLALGSKSQHLEYWRLRKLEGYIKPFRKLEGYIKPFPMVFTHTIINVTFRGDAHNNAIVAPTRPQLVPFE